MKVVSFLKHALFSFKQHNISLGFLDVFLKIIKIYYKENKSKYGHHKDITYSGIDKGKYSDR